MNNTQEITEFDLSLLPGWDEELKCESSHTIVYGSGLVVPDGSSCTVSVTHRLTDCAMQMFICEARARSAIKYRNYGGTCTNCNESHLKCVKVTPV